MIASGMNLVMTVIGFAVSTLFILFVCTRLICARIHLNSTRRSFPISSRSDLNMLERGLHGIEPLVVANFPTKKYREGHFSASEDAQCTVCLAEYQGEEMLRILPYCGHSFHVTCIDLWLKEHSTCPVCRISLRECLDKKHAMQPLFSSAIHSRFGFEPSANQPFNFSLARHGVPSRNAQADSTQERNCMPVPALADDATEEIRITKASVNKHVESPSSL